MVEEIYAIQLYNSRIIKKQTIQQSTHARTSMHTHTRDKHQSYWGYFKIIGYDDDDVEEEDINVISV